jgi:hypothetical protein
MTIAEIHGKVSDAGTNLSERMEDLLTSDVFGCMRYLSPDSVLIPFLLTGRSPQGRNLIVPNRVVSVHWSFWPSIHQIESTACEPDVAIGLETDDGRTDVVFVEAKYNSGLSSEEDECPAPNDQLARELDNLCELTCAALGWETNHGFGSRILLFVTQDVAMPRDLMERSLNEYRRKRDRESELYWTSWRLLPAILQRSMEQRPGPAQMAVLKDMHALLLRKGLVMFTGVDPLEDGFVVPDFYATLLRKVYAWPMPAMGELNSPSGTCVVPDFYSRRVRTQYDWPQFARSEELAYSYMGVL